MIRQRSYSLQHIFGFLVFIVLILIAGDLLLIENNTLQTWAGIFARRAGNLNPICNVFKPNSVDEQFFKAKLRYSNGSAVCYVHGTFDYVSEAIINHGTWEGSYIAAIEKVFSVDSSLGFIDLGCNIGAYTIVTAMRQRKVVAVDVNIENLKRLRKSLLENKVADKVTLVYNGISDRRKNFSITTPTRRNIGDTFMTAKRQNDSHVVSSILMDDLLNVIDFNRAILKIDIQGHEFDGFHHADQLFTEVDIPIVLMEWILIGPHKNESIPRFIMKFFERFNYRAYASIASQTALNWITFKNWPYDIVWKKNTLKLNI